MGGTKMTIFMSIDQGLTQVDFFFTVIVTSPGAARRRPGRRLVVPIVPTQRLFTEVDRAFVVAVAKPRYKRSDRDLEERVREDPGGED